MRAQLRCVAASLAVLISGWALPASGQVVAAAPPETEPAAKLELDAAPASSEPDPLAPPDTAGPAPVAPGAPQPTAEAKPAAEADPIVLAVRQQLATLPARPSAAEREDWAALAAYYANGDGQPVWTCKTGLAPRGQAAIAEIGKAGDWGLKAADFELPSAVDPQAGPDALATTEIKLARAALKYARHARGGRLEPSSVSRIFDQKPVLYDPKSLLEAMAASEAVDTYLKALHPQHPQFERLRQALLAARSATASRDTVQRILVNMERWRWMPEKLGELYVWDSVPEQITRVVDKGKVVLAEKIVVGKGSSPTPIFSADMQFIIFHPEWGVPDGIKSNELGPKLKKAGDGGWFSSGYSASALLKNYDLRVSYNGRIVDPDSVNWSSANVRNYSFVQPAGAKNVLGIVKFRFPNKHDVYMHDTPERHLFNSGTRAFSHGCMRVQNPVHLAEVLLAHDKGFSKEKVAGYVQHGGEIKLTTPIPVHIAYFTAVVDDDGKLHNHADIYGLDSRVASALEGGAVHLASAVAAEGEPAAPRKPRGPARKSRQATAPQQQPFNPFGNN